MAYKTQNSSQRFKEIISVLTKYKVIECLARQTRPENVRMAFEELGPTFVKIGQALSLRSDMIKPDFANELKKLQYDVKAEDFEVMQPLIEEYIGMPLSEVFENFEQTPIAAASIAQVYRATLKNGQDVVVKVQRPDVQETIELDISLLEKAVPLIKRAPTSKIVDPSELVAELKRSLLEELDFDNEVSNIEAFYEKNVDVDYMLCAKARREFSSKKLLIMDYMDGEIFSDYIAHCSIQRKTTIARQILDNYMNQVFIHGFFHADPHPGNILIKMIDGKEKITYIDFGLMGKLDKSTKEKFNKLIVAIFSQQSDNIATAILRICRKKGPIDMDAFSKEVGRLFSEYYDKNLEELCIPDVFEDITNICSDFDLKIPQNITLLFRGVITLEGVVQQLDRQLSLMSAIEQFAKQQLKTQFDIEDEFKRYLKSLFDMTVVAPKIPAKLLDLAQKASDGRLKVGLEQKNLDSFAQLIVYITNRIIIGIAVAALIIGSSIMISTSRVWGVMGFAVAFVLSTILVLTTINRKK